MKGFGTYENFKDRLYRKEAYLQWGHSENTLGVILLHNPGSVALKNKKLWTEINNGKVNIAFGELDILQNDPLIRVKDIIEYAFEEPDGRLYIYNLFNLVDSNRQTAYETYEKIMNETPTELLYPVLEKLIDSPWIWLAWTVSPPNKIYVKSYENLALQMIQELEATRNFNYIGWLKDETHPETGYSIYPYYPPAPYHNSPVCVEEYKKEIARQIRELTIRTQTKSK
ncbi:hypothetical protein ACIQAA_27200 [Neobacillus sp. NPDC093182]|uniref:hypothetical protein n=1 Tax=Neobacillus sp. NPDC093182 TaxID=3364297 RepID=UPI00380C160A